MIYACRNTDWGSNHARIQQKTLRMVLTLIYLNNNELGRFVNAMFVFCVIFMIKGKYAIPELLESAQLQELMYYISLFIIMLLQS